MVSRSTISAFSLKLELHQSPCEFGSYYPSQSAKRRGFNILRTSHQSRLIFISDFPVFLRFDFMPLDRT